jgi:hypothetical protein
MSRHGVQWRCHFDVSVQYLRGWRGTQSSCIEVLLRRCVGNEQTRRHPSRPKRLFRTRLSKPPLSNKFLLGNQPYRQRPGDEKEEEIEPTGSIRKGKKASWDRGSRWFRARRQWLRSRCFSSDEQRQHIRIQEEPSWKEEPLGSACERLPEEPAVIQMLIAHWNINMPLFI